MIVASVLFIACVALMQMHSMHYFIAHAGAYAGVLWSLTLEAGSAYLLIQDRFTYRAAGAAGAALMLCIVLFSLASPLLHQFETAKAARRALVDIEEQINALEKQRETFLRNSEKRAGWLTAIERTEAKIDALDAKRMKMKQTKFAATDFMQAAFDCVAVIVLFMLQMSALQIIKKAKGEKMAERIFDEDNKKKKNMSHISCDDFLEALDEETSDFVTVEELERNQRIEDALKMYDDDISDGDFYNSYFSEEDEKEETKHEDRDRSNGNVIDFETRKKH